MHVTGQRQDGYHLLDSLVVFCGIGDVLHASAANTLSLTLEGPFGRDVPADFDNLVLRAARLFASDRGLAFTLIKNLPPSSGIGGGSADAAAAIRAVLRLGDDDFLDGVERLAEQEKTTILSLGADIPVCLASRTARMRGIGQQLDWLSPLPPLHMVLVNPRVAVPTPAVFKALANKDNPPMPDLLPDWPDATSFATWLQDQRNDLELPACTIAPVITDVLAALRAQRGTVIARMSGSGATCFALFETEALAKAAAGRIVTAHPLWWTASGPILQ